MADTPVSYPRGLSIRPTAWFDTDAAETFASRMLRATEETSDGERALQIENCKLKIANWENDQAPSNLQFSICNFQFAVPFRRAACPLWLTTVLAPDYSASEVDTDPFISYNESRDE